MRPTDLTIVHLTPGRLWQKAQASPAFRSPAPWLSRPVPSPLPSDEKIPFPGDVEKEKLPPRYSRHPRGRSPPHYSAGPNGAVYVFSERRRTLQEFFSELFGTFIMILMGDGVVAQTLLSKGTRGGFESVNWAWGYVIYTAARCFLDVQGSRSTPTSYHENADPK